MSHARMTQRVAELKAEIKRMLAEADQTDVHEDAIYGRDRRGDELPQELRRRQDRLRRIEDAKAELEAEARAAREKELAERAAAKDDPPDDPPPPELPDHRVRHTADGQPAEDAQRNFTDPDSRIMKAGGEFVQAYNAQSVVDDTAQIIVATAVTNQGADARHLPAMVAAIQENLGRCPVQLLGDAGYYSAENTAFCEDRGIDALLALSRERRGRKPPSVPMPASPARANMRRELATAIGKGAYSRRKCIVEPVFGQIKGARGIRTFLLRGLDNVRGEWSLICLTHNLLKRFRFTQRSALAMA